MPVRKKVTARPTKRSPRPNNAPARITDNPKAAASALLLLEVMAPAFQRARNFAVERYGTLDSLRTTDWLNGALYALCAKQMLDRKKDADPGEVTKLYVAMSEIVTDMLRSSGGLDLEGYAGELLARIRTTQTFKGVAHG